MKKEIVIIGLIFLLVGLTGCTSSEEEKFIGTWKNTETSYKYNFYVDLFSKKVRQTCGGCAFTLNWKIEDNELYLYEDPRSEIVYNYKFNEKGNLCLDMFHTGQYICFEKVS